MTTLDKPTSITYRWPAQGEWTYADYARLPDDGWRHEIIRGELHMSPAPTVAHQSVSITLSMFLYEHVRQHNLGRVLFAPLDVKLFDETTVVQPDIIFIRAGNLAILKSANVVGVPDLIVEILSPSTAQHDRYTKYHLYAEAGVREYWIIDPDTGATDVYAYRSGGYLPLGHYERGGVIESEVLPGLRVPVDEIVGRG